jgi:adenosylcobinamide-GDP ribazoletransferase
MLKRELEYFFGALRFFTRLPVPAWVGHSSEALDRATRYFPAVGLLIGAIAALVFVLASCVWPTTLAVLAAMASSLYLTGAFHEDGWSDMVDGFGGGWDKAQILTIMKDSRIGSFGAVALVMLLLARFCALIELDRLEIPLALLAGHTLSRFAATTLLRGLDYVRDEGKAKPLATRISWGELGFAGLDRPAAAAAAAAARGAARLPVCRTGHALAGAPVPAADRRLYRRLPRRHAAALRSGVLLRAAVQLFLIRHPRPLLAAGICYGQLDVEAEDPQPIAERLRPLLPADTPVIASPLQRARGLAEALHPQARCDRRLLEIDFGAWEGQALGPDRPPPARCLGGRCPALRPAGR